MIEYKDFWDIVYDDRDEKRIKKVVGELNSARANLPGRLT
jgi:hypothetical protein